MYLYDKSGNQVGSYLRISTIDSGVKKSTKELSLSRNSRYTIKLSDIKGINSSLSVTRAPYSGVKYYNGKWVYFNNGKADYSFTGVARTSNDNWIFVKKGVFDTTYSGVAKSTSGSWVYVKKGRYCTSYTGVARSTTGNWIYVIKGRFSANAQKTTGVERSTTGNYVYVKNG